MPQGRPSIPADLERAVKLEAGFRCAVPNCKHPRIQLAHIDPFRQVGTHEFNNLIALCPNCHDLYDRTKEIDRKALRQIKANLAVMNSRYGELERRVLDHFAIGRQGHCGMYALLHEHFGEPDAEGMFEAFVREARRQGVEWDEQTQEKMKSLAGAVVAGRGQAPKTIQLACGFELMLMYLIRDSYLEKVQQSAGISINNRPIVDTYRLTPAGEEFVDRWVSAESIESFGSPSG